MDFCQAKLSFDPVMGPQSGDYQPLSGVELGRIHCALYRFQLLVTLLERSLGVEKPREQPYTLVDTANIFYSTFNTWEVEKIACVWEHMCDRYSDLCPRAMGHRLLKGCSPVLLSNYC
jgi:hypothetical protein